MRAKWEFWGGCVCKDQTAAASDVYTYTYVYVYTYISSRLLVTRGGCGAKSPPLAARPATTDLGLFIDFSMLKHVR